MKLVEINWQPGERQLRQFGAVCAVALPSLAWLWGGSGPWIFGLGVVGVAMAGLGWTRPRWLRPLFLGLSLITVPIGMILGEVAMLFIFFGLFLPIGLAMKLVGRDALQLRRAPAGETYWQPKKQPRDAASYYRQS